MIITFTGPSCSGKTTIIKNVFWKAYFNSYKLIESHTRKLKKEGYDINDKGTDKTQIKIIDIHHMNYLDYQCASKQNHITDRCILDGLVYTEWLFNKQMISENILNYAKAVFNEIINKYDVIFYCEPVKYKNDEDRRLDLADHEQICSLYEKYINGLKNVIKLNGTIEKRLIEIDEVLK